jgi:hypothetical protein
MKFDIYRKTVEKIQVSLKSDKNSGSFTCRPTRVQLWCSVCGSVLLRTREMLTDESYGGNRKTRFMASNLFPENRSMVEKYCAVGQATDDSVARAHCILETQTQNL